MPKKSTVNLTTEEICCGIAAIIYAIGMSLYFLPFVLNDLDNSCTVSINVHIYLSKSQFYDVGDIPFHLIPKCRL